MKIDRELLDLGNPEGVGEKCEQLLTQLSEESISVSDFEEDGWELLHLAANHLSDVPDDDVQQVLSLLLLLGDLNNEAYRQLLSGGYLKYIIPLIFRDEPEPMVLLSCLLATCMLNYSNVKAEDVADTITVLLMERLFCMIGESGWQDHTVTNAMRLIIAINMLYPKRYNNVVMRNLSVHKYGTAVAQSLISVFNRNELLDGCFKMIHDIFGRSKSATLIYTNDLKVLVDVCVREIRDLPEHDATRVEYVKLLHLILRNSDYFSHKHHIEDVKKCIDQVASNEVEPAAQSAAKSLLEEVGTRF